MPRLGFGPAPRNRLVPSWTLMWTWIGGRPFPILLSVLSLNLGPTAMMSVAQSVIVRLVLSRTSKEQHRYLRRRAIWNSLLTTLPGIAHRPSFCASSASPITSITGEHDFSKGYDGKHVVAQNLHQVCVFKVAIRSTKSLGYGGTMLLILRFGAQWRKRSTQRSVLKGLSSRLVCYICIWFPMFVVRCRSAVFILNGFIIYRPWS